MAECQCHKVGQIAEGKLAKHQYQRAEQVVEGRWHGDYTRRLVVTYKSCLMVVSVVILLYLW